MSVYGGDSWGREAQYRKRRVDDLVVEALDGSSSYRKLPSGKYACLVCPHNPILDTPLMLSLHVKGSRHRVAQTTLKEKEIAIQAEISKRQAVSGCSSGSDKTRSSSSSSKKVNQPYSMIRKPLIEQNRSAASEIFCSTTPKEREGPNDVKSSQKQSTERPLSDHVSCSSTTTTTVAYSPNLSTAWISSDLRERREREIKFIEAGWKRDGHGKWHKDENVEFDSDEDDPNHSLT